MAFVEWGLPHQNLFQYEPDRNGGASILRPEKIGTAKDESTTLIWNDLCQMLFFYFCFIIFLTLDSVGCFDNESV